MRAVIISAGRGTRLLPLTLERPKCLVEVDGRAILDRQLDALAAAGVARAVVVGGYRVDQIAAHLRRARPPVAVELVLNPFWNVASSIGSVWAARARLAEPFILLNGDTLFSAELLAHACRAKRPGVSLLVEPLAAPEPDDMLVRAADGRVLDVAKDLAGATHRSLGAVLSSGGPDYARALEAVIGAEAGTQAYHHAVVARLARDGVVHALPALADAPWREIDRAEDIARWVERQGAGA